MNPAEGSAPIYPTDLIGPRQGELMSYRDGIFANRYGGAAFGQREAAWKNGVFGPALGQTAEASMPVDGPLRAFRDGVFSRMRLSEMPPGGGTRVRAFHDGIFGGAVGQNEDAAPLDMHNDEVVRELTDLLGFVTEYAAPVSTEWTRAHSDALVSSALSIGTALGIDPGLLAQGGPDIAYPTAAWVSAAYGLMIASPAEKPQLAFVTTWIGDCASRVPTGANGSYSPDELAARLNASCPVIPPDARGALRASFLLWGGLAVVGVGVVYLATRRRRR